MTSTAARPVFEPSRPPRQSLALGVTSSAEPPALERCARLRCAATREEVAAPCARPTHRAPPSCAPVLREGDLWGDLNTVGREAGSPLRLLNKAKLTLVFGRATHAGVRRE